LPMPAHAVRPHLVELGAVNLRPLQHLGLKGVAHRPGGWEHVRAVRGGCSSRQPKRHEGDAVLLKSVQIRHPKQCKLGRETSAAWGGMLIAARGGHQTCTQNVT
jgi:hypothetical protein